MSQNLTAVAAADVFAHMSCKHEVTRFAKADCDIFLPEDHNTTTIWVKEFLTGQSKVSRSQQFNC